MTIVEATRPVTGGVDTHLHVHVAATLDSIGGLLGVESFPTTPAGYRKLLGWMSSFGPVERVGVEGTGAYGAGLARYLHRHGVTVIEVDRANPAGRDPAQPSKEGLDNKEDSFCPVSLDTCLRAVAARRENLGGDGHRRTFIRSTPAERSEGEGGRTLWPVELRCGCRRGWGTRAVAEGAKS